MHLATTTYVDHAMAAENSDCQTSVHTMVHVIWHDLKKVRVEAEA